MRRRPFLRRLCCSTFCLPALIGAGMLAPGGANAAYPGSNGLIAYGRFNATGPDIFVVNADGSFGTNITRTPDVGEFDPAFSPDGTKIAFDAFVGNALTDVYMMNVDGSTRIQLTSTPTISESYPVFSPDGSMLVFVRSPKEGGADLWVVNADGTGAHAVTQSSDIAFVRPSWRPDGSTIAFARSISPRYELDLYLVDVGTGAQTELTSDQGDEFQPDYSPDGSRIAFHRFTSDDLFQAYVMNADGTASRALGGGGDQIYSAWAPDGTGVLVVGYSPVPTLKLFDVSAGTSTLVMRESAGQVSWQPCFATCELTQPAPSEVGVYNSLRSDSTKVSVEVIPFHVGSEVEVTLFRRTDGPFRKVGSQTGTVGRRGLANFVFPRFDSGRCKAVAEFGGDADHTAGMGRIRFRCKGFTAG